MATSLQALADMLARSLSMIPQTTPARHGTTHSRYLRRVEEDVPAENVAEDERVIPVEQLAPAEQVTPRVAVAADAATWFALLPSPSRQRLLKVMDHLSELAELVPPSSRSWDATRLPTGAFALEFGGVTVRYRIDESDASLVLEDVALRPAEVVRWA